MARKATVVPATIVVGDLPFEIEPDRYYNVTFEKVTKVGGITCRPGITYMLIGSKIAPLAASLATVEPV